MRRAFLVVLLVLVASVAASFAAWWSLVSPTATGIPLALVKVINMPPAVVGVAIGRKMHGGFLSAVIRECDFCSPREHMVSYFSVALPAYMLLFGASAALIVRRKSRSTAAA